MKTAIIFGGSGYIGSNMLSVFLQTERFDKYVVCDIRALSGFTSNPRVIFQQTDVREPIMIELGDVDPASSWIFNFAAVHREPGHEFREYFDTNVPGAKNVNEFARKHGLKNIFFTSSIAPYGRSLEKRNEGSPLYPETAYGISKALAEQIHRKWLAEEPSRRLIIVRPSVIFGPRDPGNVYRMVKALKKGTFILPNGGNVIKAYGYIFGLIDSILFTMELQSPLIVYNYAENPLVPLKDMVRIIKKDQNYKRPTLSVPVSLLSSMARMISGVYRMFGKRSDIHPVRVKKAGFPTNIEPRFLMEHGFEFKYDLKSALQHWKASAPEDFQ